MTSSSSFPSSRRITFQQTKHIQFGHIVETIHSTSFGFRYTPTFQYEGRSYPAFLDVTLKQLFSAHRLDSDMHFPPTLAGPTLSGVRARILVDRLCFCVILLTVQCLYVWLFCLLLRDVFFMNVIYLLLLLFLAVPQCSCKNGNLYKQCLCCYFVLTTSYHYVLYT